ncbi:RHS repeat-associated core domain-containing protein [Kitasatospora purpeofusca]|uniref:RHS repeat-associated core domain-containing protein n=1 Tax=Kitasatospora purpeofusca TaxID=67352 RepID=UPI0035E12400
MNVNSPPFTQAVNFVSAVSGGVDPRTGLFGIRVDLGSIVGNRNLGPSLPLALHYSPLARTDAGFGRGVSLGLTTYDRQERLLALSTGEQYKVDEPEDGTAIFLRQKKLDTIRVAKDQDSYQIVHKSRDVEVLSGPDTGGDLKVPIALLTPAGHRLDLTWDQDDGGTQPRLQRIEDEHDRLLTVEYTDSVTTLTFLPDDPVEGYKVELGFMNGMLDSVRHFGSGENEPLVWTFTSELMGQASNGWGSWITEVTCPGGMTETVTYRNDGFGHQFPESAHLPVLPYVTQFVQAPQGGQPPITATFDFTDKNFIGGNSQLAWDPDRDNLFDDFLSDYTYGSTESRKCGDQETTITRIYNQYHLQTEETTEQNGFSHSVITEYYAKAGRTFDEQPAQFQLPKSRTVTWTDPDGTRPPEVTTTEFDEWANPTKRTDPDGAVTEWTYQEPKDNDGFFRLPKTVTRTPAPDTDFEAPTYTTAYEHTAYSPTADPRVGTAMLKTLETRAADRTLLTRETYDYDTTASEFGRLVKQVTIENPGHGNGGSPSTHTFAFSVDSSGVLVQKHTLTAHDNLSVTRTQQRSRFTGRLWSSTDAQDTTVTMAYDQLGRMLSRIANPGTEYEAKETWEYTVASGDTPFTVTSTDVMRNQVRETLDGAGRPIKRERKEADGGGAWHTVQDTEYDEQGRTLKVSVLDQAESGPVELIRTLSYDDWGQLEKTAYNSGAIELTRADPVRLTTTTQLLGGGTPVTGTEVTTHNLRGEAVRVERFDLRDNSVGRRTLERDGWGRLREETDELGRTTTYQRDERGRLTLTTLPDPEHTQISRTYEPSSRDELITQIGVDKVVYGTQTFDGLGRPTTTASGGRTWSYGYDRPGAPYPASATGPDGQKLTYRYVPELGSSLTQIEAHGPAGEITQQFTHHKATGWLTSAQEGTAAVARDYSSAGRLTSDTSQSSDQDKVTTEWTYTACGLEQSYTWVDPKATQTIERDTWGRIKTVTDPAMKVAVDYDGAGRIVGWTADDGQGHTLVTVLTLDDFGRETRRTVTDSRKVVWTLTQAWLDNGLLEHRTLTRDGTKLRDESFVYSSRNQLADYTCDGTALPQDEYGDSITRQVFTYDRYGNVATCRTTSSDGSSVTANHRFAEKDPCQLTGIDYTDAVRPARTLQYDASGRLVVDASGRKLGYDALGRLTAVGPSSSYGYDPLDRLLTQQAGGTNRRLTYRKQGLASVTEGGQRTRLLGLGQACVAQHREGSASETRLLVADGKQTVLAAATGGQHEEYAYTPYGYRATGAASSVLGYDGQWADPALSWLHLGDGYRAYDPALMRFTTPDSASPFGAGGVNPYAYCLGDPINRTDQTGHLSWNAWLGIGLGAAFLALAVVTAGASIAAAGGVMAAVGATSAATLAVGAAGVVGDVTAITSGALEEASPKASSILGWVSLGAGLGGLGEAGAGAVRAVSRLARRTPEIAEDAVRDSVSSVEAARGTAASANGDRGVAATEASVRGPVMSRGVQGYESTRYSSGRTVLSSRSGVGEVETGIAIERAVAGENKVVVLSGVHGIDAGDRFIRKPENMFYKADRLTKDIYYPDARLKVYDLGSSDLTDYKLQRILTRPNTTFVWAFCHSSHDPQLLRFAGLPRPPKIHQV